MREIIIVSFAALLGTGCVADTDSSQQRGDVEADDTEEDDGDDRDDCKVEGDVIGRVGASVTLGDTTVVFESWVAKADSPGEYVGFTLSTGEVGYVVKTGGERYAATGATWMHPEGDEGPEAPGISNVDFCDEPPDDCECDDDGGGDGDGGGEDGGDGDGPVVE